jgi:molybdopterin converting factor small subunit
MGLFGDRRRKIKVHVMIRGRIGDGWYEIDEKLKAPEGITLAEFIELGEARGIPFGEALENSPHLRDTLMLNGDRCPVADNSDRVLADGDEIYLLAPLAGG